MFMKYLHHAGRKKSIVELLQKVFNVIAGNQDSWVYTQGHWPEGSAYFQ